MPMLGPIRFLLAALVVLAHTEGYPHGLWPDPGLPAVIAFFVISGYLMPAAFAENYVSDDFGRRTAGYLIGRLLRIFPLYWLTLIAAIVLKTGGWEFAYAVQHPEAFVQNFLLIGLNQAELWGRDVRFIGPAWTLDIELQYYLLVPLLACAQMRARRLTIVAVCLTAVVGLALLLKPTGLRGIDYSLLPWWPFFATGYLAHALGLRFPRSFTQPRDRLGRLCGDLSYPLYVVHRPLLETGLPVIAASILGGGGHLAMTFVAGLAVSTGAAYLALIAIDLPVAAVKRALLAGIMRRPVPQGPQAQVPPAS